MKVLVLTGSPHKQGTSALLADEFIRGAKESGNKVFRFDSAFEDVHTCKGRYRPFPDHRVFDAGKEKGYLDGNGGFR
jgi:NAD(P)H-dependent FMN reductase